MPRMRSPSISATPNRSASGTSFSRILAPLFLALKIANCLCDRAFDYVVAQNHADAATLGEVLRQRQSVRDPAFAFLVRVIDVFQAEFLAVCKKTQKIARNCGRP